MQHSLHTNYQTSFRIQREDSQTFFNLLKVVFDWVSRKEKEGDLKRGWKDFSFKGSWPRCFKTDARIITETCIEGEDMRAWSMEYVHPDRELGRERYWHTNIGVRDLGDQIVMAVQIAYSWNQESLQRNVELPSASVPFFVRRIVKEFKVFTGGKMLRVIEEPVYIRSAKEAALLPKIIFSNERKYPLIVFNGSSALHIKEAKFFAAKLTGKAQILVIMSDFEIGEALKENLDPDFHIYFNRMRVFYPVNKKRLNPNRHRFFDVQSGEFIEQREGIVHGLLCNHTLVEKKAILNQADIKRLISRRRIEQMREKGEGSSDEQVEELYKYIEEVEQERDSVKIESDEYVSQIDCLEANVSSLEWKAKSLENITPQTNVDLKDELFELPSDLHTVVILAAKVHADTLIFAKEAFSSAKDHPQCELHQDAWQILSHLSSTLHDLKFSSGSSNDLSGTFQSISGYEYAKTEGAKTKGNSKLCNLRNITHNGKDYEIWPHIKKGNDPSGKKCVRIHFDFDEEERKILVGYVGSHMDNGSTK